MKNKMSKKIIGIDLFCGIGGLTHGLYKSGINIKAGFDIDETCRFSFCQKNNGNPEFINKDIKKLKRQDVIKYFEKNAYRLVAGCAPCQPYSLYQKKKDFKYRAKHQSYGLIENYIKVVKWVNPHFVIMENVPNLKNDPYFKKEFIDFFKNKYEIYSDVVNMADYGAPQNRKRLLFVAIKKNLSFSKLFKIPKKLKIKKNNVIDAIGFLPKIKAGQRDKSDYWHVANSLSELNLKRIKKSIPGGTWKDWPEEILLDCYKRLKIKSFLSVYGRLRPDRPSPTLTTKFISYGTGRYGHYEQDRALSIREGAILQTFPISYEFNKKLGKTIIARQIGNAVPPLFARILGKELIKNV